MILADITVDTEVFAAIGHKLIMVLSELSKGFDAMATELETGQLSRSEVARQVRDLATYATAAAKEISL